MNELDIDKIKSYIDEQRKSMSWYERTKRDFRNRYLGYKFRFQDWLEKNTTN